METAVWWSSENPCSMSPIKLTAKSCALLAVTTAEDQRQSLGTEGVMHISLLSYTHEYNKALFFFLIYSHCVKEASGHGFELNPE